MIVQEPSRNEETDQVSPDDFLCWFSSTSNEAQANKYFADWLLHHSQILSIHAYVGDLPKRFRDKLQTQIEKKMPGRQAEQLKTWYVSKRHLPEHLAGCTELQDSFPMLGEIQGEFHLFLEQQTEGIQKQLLSAWHAKTKRKPPTNLTELLNWVRKNPTAVPETFGDDLSRHEMTVHLFDKCPDYSVRTAFATEIIVARQLGEGVGDKHFNSGDESFLWQQIRKELGVCWPGRQDNPLKDALLQQWHRHEYERVWNFIVEILRWSLPHGEDSILETLEEWRWHNRIWEIIPEAETTADNAKKKCLKDDRIDLWNVFKCLAAAAALRNDFVRLAFDNRDGLKRALRDLLHETEPGTKQHLRLRELSIATDEFAAWVACGNEAPSNSSVARCVYERTGRKEAFANNRKVQVNAEKQTERDLLALNLRQPTNRKRRAS